jgi:hypothetical protein
VTDEAQFWRLVRQSLLMFVDAIERRFMPGERRTAELRKRMRTQPERDDE